ncbi:hypothetical protein GvMRE_IIg417 [endosymbiont GvMRE of Glomus versiforme]|nr:hypothetical protein GvMRE_IIg417 [endosymbiont GvMRE of Glomus versiforme]
MQQRFKLQWWFGAESNCRPSDLQSDALTNWATKPFKIFCYNLYIATTRNRPSRSG